MLGFGNEELVTTYWTRDYSSGTAVFGCGQSVRLAVNLTFILTAENFNTFQGVSLLRI